MAQERRADDLPTVEFPGRDEWRAWPEACHAASVGVLLVLVKKDAGRRTVAHADALEVALAVRCAAEGVGVAPFPQTGQRLRKQGLQGPFGRDPLAITGLIRPRTECCRRGWWNASLQLRIAIPASSLRRTRAR